MSKESAKKLEQEAGTPEQAAGSPEPTAAEQAAPPPDGNGSAQAAPDEAATIARLDAEVAELRDRLLRALAETENVRRRAERDRKDAETYGGTKLARDLLSVHDNLDRALGHVDERLREDAKGFIEGVELTQRELLNAFAKHKIEKVTPAPGEKFDPHRHQAMFEAPVPGAEPGTIIEVMQAGFIIADRLLRPALVGVARAMPAAPAESKDGDKDAAPTGGAK